jgi:cell division protein FtsZ
MTEMGKAMMGTGEATGDDRALMAAQNAIQNPLLDEVSLKGAKAVLVNVTGGLDMTLLEVDEAANAITDQVDVDANVIFGAAFDPSLEGMIRVSVVATGMDGASIAAIESRPVRNTRAEPLIVDRAPVEAPIAEAMPEPVMAAASEPAAAAAPAIMRNFGPLTATRFETPASAPVAAPEAEATDESQRDLYFAEPVLTNTPAAPVVSQPVVTKIVDPMAAEEGDEPLFVDSHFGDDRRPHKGGWLSLFGGARQQQQRDLAAAPPAPTRAAMGGGARPAAQPMDAPEQSAEGEDLEIPSFLRRLAN